MLVQSQGKNIIYNFDNAIKAYITEINNYHVIAVVDINNDITTLGGFKTRERAMSELKSMYKSFGMKKIHTIPNK